MSVKIIETLPMHRTSRLLWILWASYFTFGLVLNVIGAVIPILIQQNHLSLFLGGLLAFASYLAFGICAIPAGIVADRIGAKPVVVSGVLLMTAGCGVIALTNSFVIIVLSSFVIGSGIALLQTAGNPLVAYLDRAENYHRNLTLTIGFCGIGAFTGPIVLNAIQSHGEPWQRLYGYYALLCAALLLCLARAKFPMRESVAGESFHMREMAALLRSPIAIVYFWAIFFYVGAEVGTASWIIKFLQQVHGMTAGKTGCTNNHTMLCSLPSVPILTVSMFWGLQGVGRLTSGPWIKRFGARSVLRLAAFGALASLIIAIFAQAMVSAIAFAACGFFTSVLYTLIFSGAINTFSHSKSALSGLFVTASIGGAIIPPLVGIAGDHLGLRAALTIPALCFAYVLAVSVFGRAKYE